MKKCALCGKKFKNDDAEDGLKSNKEQIKDVIDGFLNSFAV